ncbi:MAG: extracellular solute-binding protein [Alphaproteobacteria bacterium]
MKKTNKIMTRKRLLGFAPSLVAGLVVGGLLLPAALPTSASAQVLRIYNWTDYTPPGLLKKFEKETGIKVQLDTFDSNETLLAKMKSGGGVGYDLFVPTQNFVQIFVQEGLLEKVDIKNMPNYKYVDKKYRNPEWDPSQEYTVPWQIGHTSFAYNSSKYKGKGKSWKEFFAPDSSVKGKLAVFKSPSDVVDSALIYTGAKLCSENPQDYKKVLSILEKQKPFVRVYSSENVNERLKSGEVIMTNNWDGNTKRAQVDEGLRDVKLAFPKEGTVGFFDVMVMSSKAKNKDAAKKFMNFIMHPKNMAIISNAQGYANAIPKSKRYLDKALRKAQALNPPRKHKIFFTTKPCGQKAIRLTDRVWTSLQK